MTAGMKTPKQDEEIQDIDQVTLERLRAMQKMVSPPSLEKASSLDARLEFERQMGEIMEATKVFFPSKFYTGGCVKQDLNYVPSHLVSLLPS